MKTVRFSARVTGKYVQKPSHVEEMRMFYSAGEYASMALESKQTIHCHDNGFETGSDCTLRGLESFTGERQLARVRTRRRASRAVLRVQDEQVQSDVLDEAEIAMAYSRHSSLSSREAHKRGLEDARDALQEEEDIYPTILYTKDAWFQPFSPKSSALRTKIFSFYPSSTKADVALFKSLS